MTTNEKAEKKGLEITDWVKLVGVMASILVAITMLLSASENVPSWWFQFSLIFLMGLVFSVPCMIFAKPISKRVKKLKLERKQNAITRKHFAEFKNLVDASKKFNRSIRDILQSLRTHYASEIKSPMTIDTLQSYNESEIQRMFYYIDKELEESNKTFRDVCLIMKHFEFVLNIYKRYLKIINGFARGIENVTKKPIAKGIEKEFESFREKYNYFVKDFQDYCQKVNQELGEREFPEWAIEHVKKW